jgi:hypothetical protein
MEFHFVFRNFLDSEIRVRVGIFWLQTDLHVLLNQFLQASADTAHAVPAQFRARHLPVASRAADNRRPAGSGVRRLTASVAARGFGKENFILENRGHFGRVRFGATMGACVGEILRFVHAGKINHGGYCVNAKPLRLN